MYALIGGVYEKGDTNYTVFLIICQSLCPVCPVRVFYFLELSDPLPENRIRATSGLSRVIMWSENLGGRSQLLVHARTGGRDLGSGHDDFLHR